MKMAIPPRLFLALCLLSLVVSGCFFTGEPVRHLSSDICLITPNLTQKEVIASLGQPDQKEKTESGELWTYLEIRKSTLRKAPFLGDRLGSEDYDLIRITFVGDRVYTCVYRTYDEEELKKSGINLREPLTNQ